MYHVFSWLIWLDCCLFLKTPGIDTGCLPWVSGVSPYLVAIKKKEKKRKTIAPIFLLVGYEFSFLSVMVFIMNGYLYEKLFLNFYCFMIISSFSRWVLSFSRVNLLYNKKIEYG